MPGRLPELGDQLHVEPYAEPQVEPADAAAQVALARLFYDGW